MPADLVTSIAGESEENRAQREQLTKQLDILMKGSETCKRFIGVGGLGEKSTQYVPFCSITYVLDRWGRSHDSRKRLVQIYKPRS